MTEHSVLYSFCHIYPINSHLVAARNVVIMSTIQRMAQISSEWMKVNFAHSIEYYESSITLKDGASLLCFMREHAWSVLMIIYRIAMKCLILCEEHEEKYTFSILTLFFSEFYSINTIGVTSRNHVIGPQSQDCVCRILLIFEF